MQHPRLFDFDDPLMGRLRSLCLVFPESREVEAWGRPTFRAGKKIFAMAGGGRALPAAVIFKPDPEERLALVEDARFFAPPYLGPAGWLAIDLDEGSTDWVELGELIETSYRQVALKRMLAALDSTAPDDGSSASQR